MRCPPAAAAPARPTARELRLPDAHLEPRRREAALRDRELLLHRGDPLRLAVERDRPELAHGVRGAALGDRRSCSGSRTRAAGSGGSRAGTSSRSGRPARPGRSGPRSSASRSDSLARRPSPSRPQQQRGPRPARRGRTNPPTRASAFRSEAPPARSRRSPRARARRPPRAARRSARSPPRCRCWWRAPGSGASPGSGRRTPRGAGAGPSPVANQASFESVTISSAPSRTAAIASSGVTAS